MLSLLSNVNVLSDPYCRHACRFRARTDALGRPTENPIASRKPAGGFEIRSCTQEQGFPLLLYISEGPRYLRFMMLTRFSQCLFPS